MSCTCYNRTTMHYNSILDYCETETCASQPTTSAFIDTVKTFEDSPEIFIWYSRTIVRKVEVISVIIRFIR